MTQIIVPAGAAGPQGPAGPTGPQGPAANALAILDSIKNAIGTSTGFVQIKTLTGFSKQKVNTNLVVREVVSIFSNSGPVTIFRVAVGGVNQDFVVTTGGTTVITMNQSFIAVFSGVPVGAVSVAVSIGRGDGSGWTATINPDNGTGNYLTATSSAYEITEE